ncbi:MULTISPECIES: peroxiredoxin [Sphingopyxis]|uniref:Thioredoxin peroxidase n=1 Tax=Sphingopyxis granuli TaxID=267128 RepID=A0AA86L5X4_9SPHN|nr:MULTISPECIES: peroxiredoxin [Sphingopyxis]AMG76165.1 Peroxiredoxin [Sphingopyxis granuli]ODU28297.1 MAG: peroxiredoxin [Sphingopyxis sp. SCN 67-31]
MDDPGLSSRPLRIGEVAPDFQARTTMGELRLSDYRGRWVLLFSHPGDFTPVCTSEFVALSRAVDRFDALNCALVAISVDSLYAHLGWIRAIRDHFGVTVGFPIVEDPSMVIGRAYGMIAADAIDAATLRATFFIDPDGVVRARICYPATVGRSVEELLRVVAALQRVDRDNVVTPEGWRPGDDVLLPPCQDQASALNAAEGPCWFHQTRADSDGKASR